MRQKSRSTLKHYSRSTFRRKNILKTWHEAEFLWEYENYQLAYFAECCFRNSRKMQKKQTYVNYRRHGSNNDNYASCDRLNNRQLWPVGYTGVWLLNALTHSAVLVRRCGKHWQLTPTPSFCKNCLNNPPLLSTATESNIHCESKKQDSELLPITSPSVDRFSIFRHWQTHR